MEAAAAATTTMRRHHRPLVLALLLALVTSSTIQLHCRVEAVSSSASSTPATSAASTSSTSSTSTSSPKQPKRHKRPPFVDHVTKEQLADAIAVAKARHVDAVKQALSNYNTDVIVGDGQQQQQYTGAADQIDTDVVEKIKLIAYAIDAPGQIPDYGEILPRTVYVTDHATPLLTRAECQECIDAAEAYFRAEGGTDGEWSKQNSGEYKINAIWIRDVPDVNAWFLDKVQKRLFPLLARTFPDFVTSPDQLCVDNTYMFKYTADTGRRTAVHTDSGCLSFTIALNSNDEYSGGGTWFEGLQKSDGGDNDSNDDDNILEMNVGEVTIRPGGVKHAGYAVTKGTRYIIGGFCMHKQKPEYVRQLLQRHLNEERYSTPEQINLLEAAVVLNPECDLTYNALANLYLSQSSAPTTEKARDVLEYCLQHVHPQSGENAFSLGSLFLNELQQYDKAIDSLNRCLVADASDCEAMNTMAEAYEKLNDHANQERLYRHVIQCASASDKAASLAYNNLGVLAEGTDEELAYYETAMKIRPNFKSCYSLASAYASRSAYPKAIDMYKRSLELLANDEGDDDAANKDRALSSLYRAAVFHVQEQGKQNPAAAATSQTEILRQLHELMGVDNYNQLAASRGR